MDTQSRVCFLDFSTFWNIETIKCLSGSQAQHVSFSFHMLSHLECLSVSHIDILYLNTWIGSAYLLTGCNVIALYHLIIMSSSGESSSTGVKWFDSFCCACLFCSHSYSGLSLKWVNMTQWQYSTFLSDLKRGETVSSIVGSYCKRNLEECHAYVDTENKVSNQVKAG